MDYVDQKKDFCGLPSYSLANLESIKTTLSDTFFNDFNISFYVFLLCKK